MGNQHFFSTFSSSAFFSSEEQKKKVAQENLHKQLTWLGTTCPFGDDEILRISRCFLFLEYMYEPQRRGETKNRDVGTRPTTQSLTPTSFFITGQFLTDWAVFCSTLPPASPSYHDICILDDNLFLETATEHSHFRNSSVEENETILQQKFAMEKRRWNLFSMVKVLEEQVLLFPMKKTMVHHPQPFASSSNSSSSSSSSLGDILYRIAFSTQNSNSTESEMKNTLESIQLFLHGLADCSRRGSRKSLLILFQTCAFSIPGEDSTLMSTPYLGPPIQPTQVAYAQDLIHFIYRIALAADILSTCIAGEILDLDEYLIADEEPCMIQSLIHFANANESHERPKDYMDSLTFLQWAESMFPCLSTTLETLMHYIFFPDKPYPPSRTKFVLPLLKNQKSSFFPSINLSSKGNTVQKSSLLFTLCCMSPSLGGSWQRIYTSEVDGLSFNRFLHSLLGYSGPTLILIRESKQKGIFGAYTHATWKESKDFYGTSDCFLFRLAPITNVYRPRGSGAQNFIYCNSESRSKGYDGLAHGIGFGGTSDLPRLFITESLDGCVASSNDLTYEEGPLLPPLPSSVSSSSSSSSLTSAVSKNTSNPQQTHQKYFDVEALEVWGVGGHEIILEALQARTKQREITNANIRKARKVDKAAFLDDLKSGLIESKAFQHREQMRGREGCTECMEDEKE